MIDTKIEAIVFITWGEKGCVVRYKGKEEHVPAFKVKEVDATGCGDAFMAGVIYKYLKDEPDSFEDVVSIARFANAVSAIVLTKVGGANSMPSLNEVKEFLEKNV